MRLFLSSFVSSIAMLSLVASAARGDTAWLDVQGEASCIPDVSKLAERIEATLAGVKNPELAVRVTLQERERGTLASVSLLSGLRVAGEKQLVAPTCDETVDAVVMVVALALSSDSDTLDSDALDSEEPAGSMNGAAEDGSYRPQVVASARTLRWQRASPASVEQDAAPESNERDSPRRAMGAAGVDRGSLGETAGLVGLGGSWIRGRAELRAAGWFALASRREEVNGDGYYRESREFAALTFDYCHGVDRGRWISACGGLEVGWMKIARVERDAAGRGVEVDHSGPLVAPGLGTLLAVRAGPVEPELSLYALFPTVGNAPDGEFLALRATLGAAIPF